MEAVRAPSRPKKLGTEVDFSVRGHSGVNVLCLLERVSSFLLEDGLVLCD